MKYKYWNFFRKGESISNIASKFNITRQGVHKSIKQMDMEITTRLLETARSSRILVEWHDKTKGVLIGISPQLGDLLSLIIIDQGNQLRIFYNQTINKNSTIKNEILKELRSVLLETINLSISQDESFKNILDNIIKK